VRAASFQIRPFPFFHGVRFDFKHLGFWGLTLAVAVFVLPPLGLLVLSSFRDVTVGDLGFSLSKLTLLNYVEAYSNPKTFTMLFHSFWFAVGSMGVALFMGGILAFLSERTDLRFRQFVPVLVLIPLIMPGVVKGIAWIFLLSPRIGLINLPWLAMFGHPLISSASIPAMIWVEGISMSPLAYLLIGSVIQRMDPSLEEAGDGSGASRWKVLSRITIPLLTPALAGVGLLLFVRGIEAFEIPMLMGADAGIFVFSTNIYHSMRDASPPEYGLGFAYSMTLVIVTIGGLVWYQRMLRRTERYTVVTGKGYQPRVIALGSWRYLAWAFVAFYGIVGILLPLFILAWASLLPYYVPPSMEALSRVSLVNYTDLLVSPDLWDAVKNTVVLGLVSSGVTLFITVLASWFIYRTNISRRGVLDFMIFLPYAFPGIIIGIAFMILFLSFENPIYNTIWIIVLAYMVNFLPIASRFTHAAVVQVHKELEEAAWASGAGFWRTLWHIWMPLLIPPLVNGGLFLLILSLKIMSIAALLQGPDSKVLAVFLWNLWNAGGTGPSSALSILMILSLGILTLISRRLARGSALVRQY